MKIDNCEKVLGVLGLVLLCVTIAYISSAQAGSLDSYVETNLMKDCKEVIKTVRASNPLFTGSKITYTDTYTFTCKNKYAYRYRWGADAVSYRVLFWNGPTATPIVVETKQLSVVQMLDRGNWTIQVEHIDALGNSYFEPEMYVNFNF